MCSYERSGMARIYRGDRTIDGLVVTVDGRPLPPRLDLKRLSDTGFEWSYEGAEPAQLALAILADYYGDDAKALAAYPAFMTAVVANFDNEWEMSDADIEAALQAIGQTV
jgi:Family of unknown function (DUF6166)